MTTVQTESDHAIYKPLKRQLLNGSNKKEE